MAFRLNPRKFEDILQRSLSFGLILSMTFGTSFAFSNQTNREGQIFYRVRPGETVSYVLNQLKLNPIYGRGNNLERMVKFNEQLEPSFGDKVYPSNRIYFEERFRGKILEVAQISDSGEIKALPTELVPSLAKSPSAADRKIAEVTPEPGVAPAPSEAAVQPPAPAAEVAAKESPQLAKPTDSSWSEFGFNVGAYGRKVSGLETSNGTSGSLATNVHPGLGVSWNPHLDENVGLDFGYTYNRLAVANATNRTLEARDQSLSQFYGGVNLQVAKPLGFDLQCGQREQLFYRAVSATGIKVEKVTVPYFQLGARLNLMTTPSMQFGVRGAYRKHLAFKTDYFDSDSGNGYFGALFVEHRMRSYGLFGEYFTSQDKFPVRGISFTTTEAGLVLGIRWKFSSDAQ